MVAARTKLLLEGPFLQHCCGFPHRNVLNLLAIAGMITFDGLFLGRLSADALVGVSLAFPFVMLMQHTAASGMGEGDPPPSRGLSEEPSAQRQSYLPSTAPTIQQAPVAVQLVFVDNPVEDFLRLGNTIALIIFGRSDEKIVRVLCAIVFFWTRSCRHQGIQLSGEYVKLHPGVRSQQRSSGCSLPRCR